MILQHKKTKRLYNFIGMESDGINATLNLELWFRDKDEKIKHAKRKFTYSTFESIKEMLNGFDELVGLSINEANFAVYEHESEKFKI